MKAHPMPHFGLPFQPRLPDKSQAEQCPFSFEDRERERKVLRDRKLEQMRNEEVGGTPAHLQHSVGSLTATPCVRLVQGIQKIWYWM